MTFGAGRAARWLGLCLAVLSAAPAPAFAQSKEVLLKQAQDAIERNDLDAALRDLNLLVNRLPDNAEAYTQRARVFIIHTALPPGRALLRRL